MARPFDGFVILGGMRTGSNYLESSLNTVEGLHCHGEAFNPVFIGYPDRKEILGVTLADRVADPDRLYDRIRAGKGLNGFRFFQDHDPRVLRRLLDDPRCAKVVLTRNPLDSFLSLQIARKTGQWKLGDIRDRKTAKVRFDAAEFDEFLIARQSFYGSVARRLQITGQAAFAIDYADLGDPAVLTGLVRFLGAEGTITSPATKLVRQNPGGSGEKVTNPAALDAALARSGVPDAGPEAYPEPLRGGAVPTFVAAAAAPLLFMPIRYSGSEAEVRSWLGALDPAGPRLVEGFTQTTLRQWQRSAPGHRKFTVVCHPLLRGWRAWQTCILAGRFADIRDQLEAHHDVPMPPDGAATYRSPALARDGFLGFLRFLKRNLDGQTAIRVDAAWATQSAAIEGFAQVALPDLILREDRLADGLAMLLASIGWHGEVPPVPEADGMATALAAIYDRRVEAAAAAAYRRDYTALGFGSWAG